MLDLCWAHVGPILGHVEPVEPKFGNLADSVSFKKRAKTQDSRAIKPPPKLLPVNACLHTENASAPSVRGGFGEKLRQAHNAPTMN